MKLIGFIILILASLNLMAANKTALNCQTVLESAELYHKSTIFKLELVQFASDLSKLDWEKVSTRDKSLHLSISNFLTKNLLNNVSELIGLVSLNKTTISTKIGSKNLDTIILVLTEVESSGLNKNTIESTAALSSLEIEQLKINSEYSMSKLDNIRSEMNNKKASYDTKAKVFSEDIAAVNQLYRNLDSSIIQYFGNYVNLVKELYGENTRFKDAESAKVVLLKLIQDLAIKMSLTSERVSLADIVKTFQTNLSRNTLKEAEGFIEILKELSLENIENIENYIERNNSENAAKTQEIIRVSNYLGTHNKKSSVSYSLSKEQADRLMDFFKITVSKMQGINNFESAMKNQEAVAILKESLLNYFKQIEVNASTVDLRELAINIWAYKGESAAIRTSDKLLKVLMNLESPSQRLN